MKKLIKLNIKNLDDFEEVKRMPILLKSIDCNFIFDRWSLDFSESNSYTYYINLNDYIKEQKPSYNDYFNPTSEYIKNNSYEEFIDMVYGGLDGFQFTIYSHEDENSLNYKTFHLENVNHELYLRFDHLITFQYEDNDLLTLVNGKKEKKEKVISLMIKWPEPLKNKMSEFGFHHLSNKKGFWDVCDKYLSLIEYQDWGIKHIFYIIQPQCFAIFEKLAKAFPEADSRKLEKMINLYSPLETHKPFPELKDVKTLSKASHYLLKTRYRIADYESLLKAENHELIGINGVNIIAQYYQLFLKFFENDYSIRLDIEKIINIIDYVKITPKTLMDRVIRNYFQFNESPVNYLILLNDTVRMAKKCHVPIKKIDNDIKLLHDNLSVIYKEVVSQEKEEKFKKQCLTNSELLKNIPESKSFTILCPEKPRDLVEEGRRMHHCVGSYVGSVSEGYSKIFFVREKNNPSKEFVTIELDRNNNLVQAKAKGNRRPPEDAMEFINQFIAKC